MQSGRSSTSSAAVSPSATTPVAELGSSVATIVKLGVGALGLAWSLTTTAAYLPPVLGQYTESTSLIGAVLAAEGLFALTLPLVIGPWSDTFHTPLGRRRPFMLVAIGPIGFCLALMAFMPNLWTTALLVFAFFFAYYVYEPPYRGLYPDLLPEQVYGRAQGVQHLFRGIALGGALIGGGVLYHLWQPAPFLAAAGIVTAACLVPVLFLREDGGHGRVFEGVGTYVRHSWRVLRRNPDVGRFLLANAAWEGTFAGARTFVILYVTVGLGEPLSTSTLVLAAVAGGYVLAALDRRPDRRPLRPRPRDHVVLARLRPRAPRRRARDPVARVVPGDHLRRRDLRRLRDDARLGTALQADAAGRAWRHLGARDDDEGHRPHLRDAARRRPDRRPAAVPAGDGRLSGAVADPGRADPARRAARLLADRRRRGGERLGHIHS